MPWLSARLLVIADICARHQNRDILKDVWERINKAAGGAAMGTGTKLEVGIIGGTYDSLPLESLARMMTKNLAI